MAAKRPELSKKAPGARRPGARADEALRRLTGPSLLLTLLVALGAPGCFRTTFVAPPTSTSRTTDVALESSEARTVVDSWQHHFLLGLVGSSDVDVRDHCPGGAHTIQTRGDLLTGTLTVVTLGAYAPRRVRMVCNPDPTKTAATTAQGSDS